jgi:hypothetical protein
MNLATIDEICRRGLLENNLPIHWYPEFLYHAATCLREESLTTLQIVNTVNLPTNDYAAADLPDDFVDDVAVCVPQGAGMFPLPKQEWLNPIRIHDTTSGDFVPYIEQQSTTDTGLNTFYGFPSSWTYYWNVNDYGEFTGRRFGAHGGTAVGYKIVPERRQIQMTDNFTDDDIILMYISNGQSVSAATQIDYRAFQTIRAYQEWKRSANANNDNSPEARSYYNQKRHLRSRMNELTKTDIQNVIRRAYTGGIKF